MKRGLVKGSLIVQLYSGSWFDLVFSVMNRSYLISRYFWSTSQQPFVKWVSEMSALFKTCVAWNGTSEKDTTFYDSTHFSWSPPQLMVSERTPSTPFFFLRVLFLWRLIGRSRLKCHPRLRGPAAHCDPLTLSCCGRITSGGFVSPPNKTLLSDPKVNLSCGSGIEENFRTGCWEMIKSEALFTLHIWESIFNKILVQNIQDSVY